MSLSDGEEDQKEVETGQKRKQQEGDELEVWKQMKITTFWSKATEEEKAEDNHRGFQYLRETFEVRKAEEAYATQQHKAIGRVQARDRQQKHRAKVLKIKMAEGWVPRKKQVNG